MSVSPSTWILDQREEARIKHRQRLLQERAQRIHQPRTTSIAVDVSALEKQIKDKELQKLEEKKKTQEFEKLARNYEQLLLEEDLRSKKELDAQRESFRTFWREEQVKEKSREYDLNCKEYLTNSLYKLRFTGEDEHFKEREKIKKFQTSQILQQQIKDEKFRREQEEAKRRNDTSSEIALRERAQRLEEAEIRCHDAQQKALHKMNLDLAAAKRVELETLRMQDRKATDEHIYHVINSTFLTEDERVAKSLLGPHKVLCDRWKGMSAKEKEKYKADLLQQIEDNKMRRMMDKIREQDFEKHASSVDQIGVSFKKKDEETKKLEAAAMADENKILSEEQRAQIRSYNMERNTNFVEDHFFNKFGVYPR